MKKRWIGILTAAAMTAAMAIPVSAAEEVYKVNCSSFRTDGSDVWASLDTNGVLTISGTGGMDSFGFGSDDVPDYPWENSEDANLIKKIVVEEGVTHFDMVWSTPEAKSVYLPNSLDTMDLFEFIYLGEIEKVFCAPQTFIGDPSEIENELIPEKIEVIKEETAKFLCTYYVYKGTEAERAVSLLGVKTKNMGDVNSDGNIDLHDASGMLELYAKKSVGIDISGENGMDTDTADLNRDSAVNIADASAALAYYANQAAGFETDWTALLEK